MKTARDMLPEIERVIAQGPYQPTWESLTTHPDPQWYCDAKFGIFIHWGAYAVPAFGNEWYPHHMYNEGSKEYQHHLKTYGPHKQFGYKDFIPLFTGAKFDAEEWAQLFSDAGARYVMPVAEHHDGFQMYDSELSRWNAAQMGPKRDIVGELKRAVEARGMEICASSHRIEHFWFMSGGLTFDSGVTDPEFADFYGPVCVAPADTHNIEELPCDAAKFADFADDWLARTCELVDKYMPRVIWFDWWIQNLAMKPYLKKFACYYYNRAAQKGVEVAINNKYDAYPFGATVFDVERGLLSGIYPRLWQNDTSIAKNSWGYTENNDFKPASDLICDLVDIVSKNGCLLLNIGPRADGTITDEERERLLAIGAWLRDNGEGIYDTTHWRVFGEGPAQIIEGAFNDVAREPFCARDIRFTYKNGTLYAFALGRADDGVYRIETLRHMSPQFLGKILSVEVLGQGEVSGFERTDEALVIKTTGVPGGSEPLGFKITID